MPLQKNNYHIVLDDIKERLRTARMQNTDNQSDIIWQPGVAKLPWGHHSVILSQVKTDLDAPSVGVLLCKTPNETVIKYALQRINKPIGVADYKLQGKLPAAMKKGMPTIEELEAELEREMNKLAAKPKKRKK